MDVAAGCPRSSRPLFHRRGDDDRRPAAARPRHAPPLVGRDREQATLRNHLAAAWPGAVASCSSAARRGLARLPSPRGCSPARPPAGAMTRRTSGATRCGPSRAAVPHRGTPGARSPPGAKHHASTRYRTRAAPPIPVRARHSLMPRGGAAPLGDRNLEGKWLGMSTRLVPERCGGGGRKFGTSGPSRGGDRAARHGRPGIP